MRLFGIKKNTEIINKISDNGKTSEDLSKSIDAKETRCK